MTTGDPTWEAKRLATLAAYDILDSPPEASIDRIAMLAAAVCATPIALVTLVAKDRQWFKSRVGLELQETHRGSSFCAVAIEQGKGLVVENALVDARFAENPLVSSAPNVRFYAGVPIRAFNGMPLGTLCVIDRCARTLTPEQDAALHALASEVEVQLELRRLLLEASNAHTARQELAALVVHDLRTPLSAALLMGRWLRTHSSLPAELSPAVDEIVASSEALFRMMQDLVDVTRSETGDLRATFTTLDLRALLETVVSPVKRHADADAHRIALTGSAEPIVIDSDVDLVRRMLENILDNALKYAPRGTEITIAASLDTCGSHALVTVSDSGPSIPAEHRDDIFHARVRLHHVHARESLGLGLRFCRLAAQALGGRVWVDGGPGGGNTFHVELPTRQALHRPD